MVIRGIVQNGEIRIDVSGILPDGSSVLVTPLEVDFADAGPQWNLETAKAKIREIADLPLVGPEDDFSGVDHDKILYGDVDQ